MRVDDVAGDFWQALRRAARAPRSTAAPTAPARRTHSAAWSPAAPPARVGQIMLATS
jgi:hypothetical protein